MELQNGSQNQPVMDADSRLVQANKLSQLGVMLIFGKRKSIDKAIKCIQKAITFNDSDYKNWQLLGEAYYQRGSLNPAINCFMKSLKLAEDDAASQGDNDKVKRRKADCTYSRLRMSDIRLSVGHLDEAALGYSDIIANEEDNVAALVGLAKTELQLARNNFSSGLVKSAHANCMHALELSLKAIKRSPQLCSTWKLASDCCLIQFVHGQKGKFATKIMENFPGSDADFILVDKLVCIELAQQFLCKAIEIEPFQKSGCLWHNLGISLYLKSTIVHKTDERDILLRRSIKCLLKALDSDRNNSQIKNSIAVVAFNSNLVNTAQSFFIKSIQSNMSTSEVQFSNLGYMYLQRGEFDLAHISFSRCQAEEPLYSRSWLGAALISERNNIDNLTQLRHCHTLENNYESQLMFATKITSLPIIDEYKRDTINALDCMKRMINYDYKSIEANTTLGLLYERCNYIDQARLCFETAHTISPQDPRIIFNRLRLYSASSSGCFNLDSNSLINNEFIKEAEKLVHGGNRDYLLNYVYFLFVNGDYKNFNQKMGRFIDKMPQSDIRNKIGSQILLGLADKAEGSDFKTWFFKNLIDLENITCIEAVINLLCLMVLGALADDEQLVNQISGDISKHLLSFISSKKRQFESIFYSQEGNWIRMVLFCSIFCQKDQRKLIRPFLALFPTNAELWLYLGLASMFHTSHYQTAVFCIKKASLIGSSHADLGVICDILLAILTQTTKFKSKSSYTLDSRVNYISRAIYKSPNYGLLWASLLDFKETNTKLKKNQLLHGENSSLFQLAIDHILRMIMA